MALLENYTIKAPFEGTLGLVEVDKGAVISPNTVITSLDDLSSMELIMAMPEHTLRQIKPGMNVSATTSAWPNQIFQSTIDAINPRIDPITLTFEVRTRFNNEKQQFKTLVITY